jgi:hypothetical protein
VPILRYRGLLRLIRRSDSGRAPPDENVPQLLMLLYAYDRKHPALGMKSTVPHCER